MEKIHVAAAAVVSEGRLLAAYRRNRGWELPGGKLEEGEDALRAAERELLEELSYRVRALSVAGTVETTDRGKHLVMDIVLCVPEEGSFPTAKEHGALKWVGKDELDSLSWMGADTLALPLMRSLLG